MLSILRKKSPRTANSQAFRKKLFMLVAGLEPARGCPRGILSPLRLPIPPHQRTLSAHACRLENFVFSFTAYPPIPRHIATNLEVNFQSGCYMPRRTRLLQRANGWRWIRTTEAICSRFTVCPLWPLGNPSIVRVSL